MPINLVNPPVHHAPFPFWFWNGTLDKKELVRQMALMREKGISEFLIHARSGLATRFLSEEWFDLVGAVIEEAARTGMKAWIYDEFNWPSGSAGQEITRDQANIEHYLDADGILRLSETYPAGSPDYLNRNVTEKFIELAYEPYFARFGKYFGTTIPGFFNDEVRFANARPWSASLPGNPPSGPEYHALIGRKIVENYFHPLSNWCEKHRVKFIGHVMGEETIGTNVRYMGDIIGCLAELHEPGTDHLGSSAEGLGGRIASSVAHLRGNPPVTCETGGDLPWDCTAGDLYRLSGWLYATGITRIILHGFFYQENANDWPPDLFYRWAGWEDMDAYVRWASRIQYFLSSAVPVIRAAVYYPYREFLQDYRPDPSVTLNYKVGPKIEGQQARALQVSLQDICRSLTAAGIDYDLVPEQWLDRVKDRVVVAPLDTLPQKKNNVVHQKSMNAQECAAEVARRLGDVPRLDGKIAPAAVFPACDAIVDPYFHKSGDEGGVLLKEFLLEGSQAFLVWNAEGRPYSGALNIPGGGEFSIFDPLTGERSSPVGSPVALSVPPYSMRIVFQ